MDFREIEEYSPAHAVYNLRDKAYNHVMLRTMKALEETEQVRSRIKTPEEFAVWQDKVKGDFKAIIGELPYDSAFPLNARTTGQIEEEDLIIENIIFEAREKVYVTANLYLPKERAEKCPAVLLQCGHSLNGKAWDAYQRAARIIADVGIVVLVMDPPGQGERCCYIEDGKKLIQGATSEHQQFGNPCFLTGDGSVKYFLADAMRAVDYLCSRPEVDSHRIGATGISGGGTLTSVLMAIDDRIKAAAPGCWPTAGWEYFLQGMSPDAEQIWPGVTSSHIDHYEIMACMCPKPLLLLAMEEDFVPIEGTEKLYAECQRLWELNGREDNISINVGTGRHGFAEENARAAAKFFAKYLCVAGYMPKDEKYSDIALKSVPVLPEQNLYCTASGQVRIDYPDSLTVYEENLREYQKQCQNKLSFDERKQALHKLVYYNRKPVSRFHIRHLNKRCENEIQAEGLLWFTQELMPCYGVKFQAMEHLKEDAQVTICLWHGGTDRLSDHREEIMQICKSGRSAFVVDLTAMGKCMSNLTLTGRDPFASVNSLMDKLSKALFMLGDSLCGIRAFDLLQTVKMVRELMGVMDIEVYAEEKYAVFARIAEILDEHIHVRVHNEVAVCDVITEKYYDPYDIAQMLMPGLGKYL